MCTGVAGRCCGEDTLSTKTGNDAWNESTPGEPLAAYNGETGLDNGDEGRIGSDINRHLSETGTVVGDKTPGDRWPKVSIEGGPAHGDDDDAPLIYSDGESNFDVKACKTGEDGLCSGDTTKSTKRGDDASSDCTLPGWEDDSGETGNDQTPRVGEIAGCNDREVNVKDNGDGCTACIGVVGEIAGDVNNRSGEHGGREEEATHW